MAFANDTFTDTAGTELSSHTPDDGGAWTRHTNGSTASINGVISVANRLRNNGSLGSDTALYYHGGSPASAEYDVQADVHVVTTATDSDSGVAGRVDTTANTCYFVRYSGSAGQWQLFKLVAGAATSLGTFGQTLTAGNSYALKLEVRDAAKKVYVGGVERISSADNAVTAAGKAGVRPRGVITNTAGYHLDNFQATDAGGGGGATTAIFLPLLGVG